MFYTGKIVGVDTAYNTLTVQAGQKDESYFTINDHSSLTACHKDISFKDLKVGDTVKLFFYSESLGGTRYIKDLELEKKC